MGWYTVKKKINGHIYFYRQTTWRENGKVKCKSIYVGKAGGDSTGTHTVHSTVPNVATSPIQEVEGKNDIQTPEEYMASDRPIPAAQESTKFSKAPTVDAELKERMAELRAKFKAPPKSDAETKKPMGNLSALGLPTTGREWLDQMKIHNSNDYKFLAKQMREIGNHKNWEREAILSYNKMQKNRPHNVMDDQGRLLDRAYTKLRERKLSEKRYQLVEDKNARLQAVWEAMGLEF